MKGPSNLGNLSKSSQDALDWAYTWREHRSSTMQSDASPVIDERDLLVGILRAHQNDSPPDHILDYFRVPVTALNQELAYDPQELPAQSQDLPDESQISPDVISLIQYGVKLAKEYNEAEKGLVRLKDLFGGLLQGGGFTTAFFRAALAPNDIDRVMDAYRGYLAAPENVSLDEIFSKIIPRPEPPSGPSAAIQMAVSGFSADTRSERDLVGIGAEVEAFAYLIANKELRPPLAIGLFGDWGSGKTYFMQSVKERVHTITKGARNSGKPQREINVFKHIVQIEFNAWHYVEGELWASLVENIFQNLQTRPGDQPSLLQQRQQHWIDKLETLREQQGAAQVLKNDLEEREQEIVKEIRALEKDRDEKIKALNKLKGEDVLTAIKLSKEDQERLNGILKDMGITKTYTSAVEFTRAFSGLNSVLERGNALTIALRQRGWRWTLGVLAIVISGPLVSLGISYLDRLIINIPDQTNALLSVTAFLGSLTGVLKAGSMKLTQAINQVEQAQWELAAKERLIEKQYAVDIAAREQEITKITQDYRQKQAEGAKLSQQIKAVENELQQITPRRVLLDFIQERAGSDDYSKKLGIAALIRRDFNQLWQLIRDQNKAFIEKDEGQNQQEDPHLINRIVLYIDDLDRCPPERVVQVLQAAHLLLAFPLFVVVIGVDARWLSQSLQTHYEGLLAPNGQPDEEAGNGDVKPATPENYLEKIFQIPFWIKPLPERAKVRIMQGLVEKSIGDRDGGGGKGGPGEGQSLVQFQSGEALQEYKPAAIPDPNPPGLQILNRELRFMEALGPLLGQTPRSVKRFVNVYWLMKSVAMTHTATFVEEAQYADYQQVLFLLAILTGTPALNHDFFNLLLDNTSLQPIIGEEPDTQSVGPKTLRQVVRQLKLNAKTLSSNEAVDYNRDLKRLDSWLKAYQEGTWLDLEVQTLRRWLPSVTRFSYAMAKI